MGVPVKVLVAALLLFLPAVLAADAPPTPAAGPVVLLGEVYYYAALADEYVALVNPSPVPVGLGGWYLSDGEGTVTLPPSAVLPGNGRTVLTQNSTAYSLETLATPDYTWLDGNATPANRSGSFALSNTGDALTLHDASGTLIDVFAWGNTTYAGAGWSDPTLLNATRGEVMTRRSSGGWVDTNTSADWARLAPRIIGQSDLPLTAFTTSAMVEAIASPGRSREILEIYLDLATASIRVSVYQLTSLAVQDALLRARVRGVSVRVLLDGTPVGGLDQREWGIAGNLTAAGAEVRFLLAGSSGVARYAHLHAKYVIVDDAVALVSSENFGDNGFPAFGTSGNRGWTVAVADPPVATYLAVVFDADFDPRRLDSRAYADMVVTPVATAPEPSGPYLWTVEPLAVTDPATVTPVIGPEHSFHDAAILGLLRSATRTLDIEAFYAYRDWEGGPNLYLEEAVAAARRGVAVRVLLDATWYNIEPTEPGDNDDTVAYLNGIAQAEGIPLQAKLALPALHGVVKYHNKGVVVDGERVFVSSFNWNLFSPARNREVGLIVENDAIAGFFQGLFVHDWKEDLEAPMADITAEPRVPVNETFPLIGLGSTDNLGVVNWSWDLDGDGDFDAYGAVVEHAYAAAGNYPVRLVVRDAWDNTDDAVRNVLVAAPSPGGGPGGGPAPFPWLLLVLAAGAFALLLLLSFTYRKHRRRGIG